MNNASYWSKRFEALSDLEYRKSEKYLIELKQKIRRSELEIKKQLEAWYTRLADNNDISYAAARKLLKRNELKEFKWDVNEYIKYGRENALDGAWIKELENASAKVHVNRLEQIQIQLKNEVEKYYADYNKTAVNHLESIAEDSYYRTAYEISKGAGVGVSFAKLDTDTLGKIVNRPWAADGKAFSDRIWTSKKEMVRTLTGELTRHVVAGTAPQKAVKVITDKFHVTVSQAKRLVLTETAAIQSEASKASLSSIGVEKYKILATLDSKTSDICRELDGKTFKMTEYKIGITAPPFHCYCRSCTVPDISDDIVEELGMTRASRDDNDEGYITTTPANATYKEWKSAINATQLLENTPNNAIMKMNLQYFAEKDIEKQSSNSLKRAIKSIVVIFQSTKIKLRTLRIIVMIGMIKIQGNKKD